MGLVQEIVAEGQALARALELAEAISTYPQTSLRTDRQCAYEGLSLPLSEGMTLERQVHQASPEPDMEERLRQYGTGQRPAPPRPPLSGS
jgi:hypothetical protein